MDDFFAKKIITGRLERISAI